MREEAELTAYLDGMLFQRRLVDFAESLKGRERVIFRDRLLASKPIPFTTLAKKLKTTPVRAQKLSTELQSRMREALRGAN